LGGIGGLSASVIRSQHLHPLAAGCQTQPLFNFLQTGARPALDWRCGYFLSVFGNL
jgi:hypothetical protein